MDETIARLNIQHYQWLLSQNIDDAKRRTILCLMAEEQAKLDKIQKDKFHKEKSGRSG